MPLVEEEILQSGEATQIIWGNLQQIRWDKDCSKICDEYTINRDARLGVKHTVQVPVHLESCKVLRSQKHHPYVNSSIDLFSLSI